MAGNNIIYRDNHLGAVFFLKGYQYEYTNDAQVDAYLSPVNAKVGGYIHKIYYKDNQKVKKEIHLWLLNMTSMA